MRNSAYLRIAIYVITFTVLVLCVLMSFSFDYPNDKESYCRRMREARGAEMDSIRQEVVNNLRLIREADGDGALKSDIVLRILRENGTLRGIDATTIKLNPDWSAWEQCMIGHEIHNNDILLIDARCCCRNETSRFLGVHVDGSTSLLTELPAWAN